MASLPGPQRAGRGPLWKSDELSQGRRSSPRLVSVAREVPVVPCRATGGSRTGQGALRNSSRRPPPGVWTDPGVEWVQLPGSTVEGRCGHQTKEVYPLTTSLQGESYFSRKVK